MTARDRFVNEALGEVGKPYDTHRDCSGFVAWAARQVGITVPEGSVAQFRAGVPAEGLRPPPGSLHFWDTYGEAPGHVAIDIGGGRIVHAVNPSVGITISSLTANMGGRNRYMGARDIFDTEGAAGKSPQPNGQPGVDAGLPPGESGPNPGLSTRRERDRERQRRRQKDRQRRGRRV